MSITDRIRTEPVIVSTLVRAVIMVAAAWGVGLTAEQIAAVLLLTEAVLALLVRHAVTPSIDAEVDL